jgi:hypothetical protein
MDTAEYFREKATQCRQLAELSTDKNAATSRGLLALALEFDARAVATDAATAASREIEPEGAKSPNGGGSPEGDGTDKPN